MNGSGTTKVVFRLWFLVIAVVVVAVLFLAKVLFLPLAFAVLFAFLLAPVVGLLERIHLPRALAAVLVIFSFAAILGTAGWMLFTQLVAITNDLPTYRDNISDKMAAIHSPSDSAFSRAQHEVERLGDELGMANSSAVLPGSRKQAGKPLGSSPDRPMQVREVSRSTGRLDQLGGVVEPLTTTLLCIVFTFFVLLQREDLRNRLIHLTGDRNLSVMTQAMDDASRRISRYFLLQLLVNLTYGSMVFAALYLIGLPHAALFGSLAGMLRFVPYLGAPIAGLLPTLLSLAVFPGWTRSLSIVGIFVVLEMLTANYAEPRIYGKHTGLSSLAILVAAGFWTLLWGPVGLILSVPLTVCLVVMGSHIPALEFLSVMLGDRPVVRPATCFYQRLLARDQREAGEILDVCLKDQALETVYDAVLIPALILSEQDRLKGDLDEPTLAFIRRTARELIDELGFREPTENERLTSEALPADGIPLKVLCVAVRDEIDEFGATMFSQLLQAAGMKPVVVTARRLEEVLGVVADENPNVIFLCGLPPFAIARARRLYRTLQSRHRHIRIMIGIFGYSDDVASAAERISGDQAVHVATTLADGLAQVRTFAGVAEPALTASASSQTNAA